MASRPMRSMAQRVLGGIDLQPRERILASIATLVSVPGVMAVMLTAAMIFSADIRDNQSFILAWGAVIGWAFRHTSDITEQPQRIEAARAVAHQVLEENEGKR